MEKVIIYGTGKLAQMVYYLMKADTRYEIIGFAADIEYCNADTFMDVSLVPIDEAFSIFPPTTCKMLTVIGGLTNIEIRKTMYDRAHSHGYESINYIHPTAILEGEITFGNNNIIFPYCVLGFSGSFGDNTIVREKVYLGHDFKVGNHCFIGVGCTIGGTSQIDDFAYIAMESTVIDHTTIARRSFIGIGSLVLTDTMENAKYFGRPAKIRD